VNLGRGNWPPGAAKFLPAESVPLAEPRRRLVRLAAYLSGAQRRSTLDLRVSPTLSLNPSPPTPAPARRGPTNSGLKTRAATVSFSPFRSPGCAPTCAPIYHSLEPTHCVSNAAPAQWKEEDRGEGRKSAH
jgi:hypothetical protein